MNEQKVRSNSKWLQIDGESLGITIINIDEIVLVTEDEYKRSESKSEYTIIVKLKNDRQEIVYQTTSEEEHKKVLKDIGSALWLYPEFYLENPLTQNPTMKGLYLPYPNTHFY